MHRRSLYFTAPRQVSVIEEQLKEPRADEVLVKTLVSAVSPGTELLVYRGQWPQGLAVDATIPALAGEFRYPLKYGYACVGRVIRRGAGVSDDWIDRLVFAFNPHETLFTTRPEALVPLPETILPERAAFLPNMETAVNFLMDGAPVIGERVTVFGQGTVGLLTTALLARMCLSRLVTVDPFPMRRSRSLDLGAHASVDPTEGQASTAIRRFLEDGLDHPAADLTFEISGNPAALDLAISVTGFGGRVVVGSWYGNKAASLDLGGYFHRSRIRMVSSQVSTMDPCFTARWSKSRRLGIAMKMLDETAPESIITHRFPFSRAAEAYALPDEHPDRAIQTVLTYEE